MRAISRLKHFEPARLDRHRLEVLVREHGEPGAERLMGRALDDLAAHLNRLEAAHRRGDAAALAAAVAEVGAVARHVGIAGLSRVAGDVAACLRRGDRAALGATVARLVRVGESTLLSVWDLQDLSG